MLLPKSALGAMWRRFRSNPAALAGLLVVLAFAACALFPSLFAGHDPAQQFRELLLLPPAWTAGGNPAVPLGTDDLGRDLAARLVHGARASLLVGASAALLGAIPGVALGLAAAILPRIPTFFLLRLFDVLLSLPGLLLAIVVVAILGPGLENAVIAIALVSLPGYARLARAGALEQLARDYVVSARIAGAARWAAQWRRTAGGAQPCCAMKASSGGGAGPSDGSSKGRANGARNPRAEEGLLYIVPKSTLAVERLDTDRACFLSLSAQRLFLWAI